MTTPNLSQKRVRRAKRPAVRAHGLARPLTMRMVNSEVLAYAGLILLSIFMHLWKLGDMALHHDEALHANFSWQFYAGEGGFSCWSGSADTYCYNPVYHGPVLYLLTYVSYFLFGVSDATARLPMALAGVGLIASCWMLRPLLGRRGALIAAVLLTISPAVLYFTRFARHDALAALWIMWLFIGIFRFWREERPGWLYLAAAALALLWATHELVFIMIFISVTFLVQRWAWEVLGGRKFVIISSVLMALLGLLALINPSLSLPTAAGQEQNILHLGGFGILGFITLLMGQLLSLRWSSKHLLNIWLTGVRGSTWLIASAVFLVVFTAFFTTFFTYPRGFIDGIYAGLAYWLGSQHSFARGDQPWFYYFMQLGVYEILPVLLTVGGFGAWLVGSRQSGRRVRPAKQPAVIVAEEREPETEVLGLAAQAEPAEAEGIEAQPVAAMEAGPFEENTAPETVEGIWSGYLFYWFFLALTIFSWAGEKMPWLTLHMAMPAALAGAWTIDRLAARIDWAQMRKPRVWVAIPIAATMLVLLVMMTAVVGDGGSELAALRSRLGGFVFVLLILLGGVYIAWLGSLIGRQVALSIAALGVIGVLGLYSLSAAVGLAYQRPDVPVEMMVYVQTAPDVPVIVDEIERIAIAQTRNNRSVADPTGGNSMKILLSAGSNGDSEGSLHQPFDWYLRDWTNVQWLKKEDIATLDQGYLDAPVAIFSRANMAPDTQARMEAAGYVKVFDTVHNWWFPEYGVNGGTGYKELMYLEEYGCDPSMRGQRNENGRSLYNCTLGGIGVLTWPFRPSNWDTLRQYMFGRELPASVELGRREMVVFVRGEYAAQVPTTTPNTGGGSAQALRLISEGALSGEAPVEPRGMTTGPDGAVYVADAAANRVLIYRTDGSVDIIAGTGDAALLEPSDVAVDDQGNLYVADTWHARIAKFDADGEFIGAWGEGEEVFDQATGKVFTQTGGSAEGNAAKPLGFFGPRGVAVSPTGRVYIADTGNKRIVITDDEGNYQGQIGLPGGGPSQFDEPIGLEVFNGELYVGDTWNGRIQIFGLDSLGVPEPQPRQIVSVPGWQRDTYFDPSFAIDSEGRIVVAVPGQNQAALINAVGEIALRWGGEGSDDSALYAPSGVTFAPDGSVYIAEKGNRRIQRWVLPRIR